MKILKILLFHLIIVNMLNGDNKIKTIHKHSVGATYFAALGTTAISAACAKLSYDATWYAYDHIHRVLNTSKHIKIKPYYIGFLAAATISFSYNSIKAMQKTREYLKSAYYNKQKKIKPD